MGIGGRIPPLLGMDESRWSKEGRYLIALAHGQTMGKRVPFTHWLIMGVGGRIPPLLGMDESRWSKEGRYLIALAHGGTMGRGSLSLVG
jgi:hypothetical protein